VDFIRECPNKCTVKVSDAQTFTKQAETFKQSLSSLRKADVNCFLGRESSADVVPLHDNTRSHTAAPLEHCWSISTGSCLTTLLTALILLRATTTCFPTYRTGWDDRASTIMSWWKVLKRGWTHRRQTFLTYAFLVCFVNSSAEVAFLIALVL
jgi:hypothetical protein